MKRAVFILLSVTLLGGCSMQKSIKRLSTDGMAASLSIADYALPRFTSDTSYTIRRDTVQKVSFRGRDVMLMSAIKDSQTGEMVITDEIEPVVVEAKFRNIAERNGYVNIAFDITVPPQMLYPECQLRLYPRLSYLSDTLDLEKVYITGEKYRREQLRGYELYKKFLDSIIPDSLDHIEAFTHKELLERFIVRNFKEIARLRYDSSFVSEGQVSHLFGVTFYDAVDHYTKKGLLDRNRRLIEKKGKMFAKYVRNPFEEAGIRLDSVVNQGEGGVKYCYRYPLKINEKVKKVELKIGGELYDSRKLLYTMPHVGPVTYYISSLSSLVESGVKYKEKVVERDLKINSTAYITFNVGDSRYCDTLAANYSQMKKISELLYNILSDSTFIADSLVITPLSSPEGGYIYNKKLSQSRANSIKEYLTGYIERFNDTINGPVWELYLSQTLEDGREAEMGRSHRLPVLKGDFIKVRNCGDPWPELERLIMNDPLLMEDKAVLEALSHPGYDARERALAATSRYSYIKEKLYPELRRVDFSLMLHRPGMVKDTIVSYQVDTLYMEGIEALDMRDYRRALTLLQPYSDINTALAYLCMGYNHSAKAILEELPKSAKRDYLIALTYARLNESSRAAEYFLSSVESDASMRHRGNLDPEISDIIKRYGLERVYNQ